MRRGRGWKGGWFKALAALVGLGLAAGCGVGPSDAGEERIVHVLSARHYDGDRKLFDRFTERTGIRVNEVKGTAPELIERLRREEGEWDLLLTVDGSALDLAKQSGVLQPIPEEAASRNVPAPWRDPDGYWVAVAARARVIVYAKDRVDPDELPTYESLTDERWSGRVLVRSSSNAYNLSLLASYIEVRGADAAKRWAQGIADNLARRPQGGDVDQALAVARGEGDVAIMNAYYIGQLAASEDEEEARAAARLGVVFPNQDAEGAHMNISGAGLAASAPNREAALRLLEFMTSEEGQTLLVAESFEFPVNAGAETPALLREWGAFKGQPIDAARWSERQREAERIFAEAGWE